MNRRSFLIGSGDVACATAGSNADGDAAARKRQKIIAVKIYRVSIGGRYPVLVQVVTDAGITGVGEAAVAYGTGAPAIDARDLGLYLGPCQLLRVEAGRGACLKPADLRRPVTSERLLVATGTFPGHDRQRSPPRAVSSQAAAVAPAGLAAGEAAAAQGLNRRVPGRCGLDPHRARVHALEEATHHVEPCAQ